MINFRTVRYKNFLSTGNKPTEIVIDDTRTTLLVGLNGSGKSTFMDAISFGLFGRPFRKVKLGQLVNSINNNNCLVELEFVVGGKEYHIKRGLKPALFEIYVDGEMKDKEASARDSQDFLERYVLRMNEHTFRQIVVLGSGSFIPFMRLSTGDRRLIIENLLDIQIFTVMNDLVKERVTANTDKISTARHQIELLKQSIKLQEEHLKSLQENNEENIQEKKDELKICEGQIKKLTEEVDALQETIKDYRPKQDKQSKLREFTTKISSKKNHIRKQVALVNDNSECPECTQPITQEHKENVTTRLSEKDEELSEGMRQISAEMVILQERISEIESILLQISDKNSSITGINMSISRLQNELEKETGITNTDQTEIASSMNDLDDKYTLKHELQEKKHHLNTVQELLKDTGIKTVIIRNYLPLINQLVNKYLSALDFYINFELDEAFNETIKSRGRDAFQYGSFSEGEKLRIDLALLFTWREVAKLKSSVATNLLILDEIFDSSLDAAGVEDFLGILNTQGDETTHVFVISHKGDQILDKFGRVISVEKEHNFSKIVTN